MKTDGGGVSDRSQRGRQVQVAYRQLRQAIIDGQLSPGARIVETELAARVRLSRSTVSTALHRLQHEGFVEVLRGRQRSGLVVCPLTGVDFWELSEIVAEVEGLAARRAACLPLESRRRVANELRAMNDELREAAQHKPLDRATVFRIDDKLHNRIVEAAASNRLTTLHHAIKPQMQRYEGLYFTMAERAHDSVGEHEQLIDAIDAGDPDAAALAARTNEMNAAHDLMKRMERFP